MHMAYIDAQLAKRSMTRAELVEDPINASVHVWNNVWYPTNPVVYVRLDHGP